MIKKERNDVIWRVFLYKSSEYGNFLQLNSVNFKILIIFPFIYKSTIGKNFVPLHSDY